MAHNSYTMCIRGLPDMYTLSPRACGPRASGVHIRQTTHAHGITITCTLDSLPTYIKLQYHINVLHYIVSHRNGLVATMTRDQYFVTTDHSQRTYHQNQKTCHCIQHICVLAVQC